MNHYLAKVIIPEDVRTSSVFTKISSMISIKRNVAEVALLQPKKIHIHNKLNITNT